MRAQKRIADFAKVSAGGTPNRGQSEHFRGRISWVKTLDLNGSKVASTEERITEQALHSIRGEINPVGTVMVAMYGGAGTIGKSGVLAVPAATNQAVASILPDESAFDSDFLHYQLIHLRPSWMKFSQGNRKDPNISKAVVENMLVWLPEVCEQRAIAKQIDKKFEKHSEAYKALKRQLVELGDFQNAVVSASLKSRGVNLHRLRDVLDEITSGIGVAWKSFRVLGATRAGLAPAREQPGKNATRYKPVDAGTVFYNPMRILIGSIAFVDEDDEPGITSPDYVVLKGKPGVVDSRWFYYWLRSPLGERCIQSLARGAVRERMLFNRLAEGEIELPDYDTQVKTSQALAKIKPMRQAIHQQLKELELLPQKLLAQVFDA